MTNTKNELKAHVGGQAILLYQTETEVIRSKERLLAAGFILSKAGFYVAPFGYPIAKFLKLTTKE